MTRLVQAVHLNILSLPGASANHFYDYFHLKDLFDTIILFIGGNELYHYTTPTDSPGLLAADKIIELANFLSTSQDFFSCNS